MQASAGDTRLRATAGERQATRRADREAPSADAYVPANTVPSARAGHCRARRGTSARRGVGTRAQ